MKTSVMLESFCADIERLVREGTLRTALHSSVALPGICSALEDAHMSGTRERYLAWCDSWLVTKPLSGGKVLNNEGLYRIYLHRRPDADANSAALAQLRRARRTRRERTLARSRVWQPINRLQSFQLELIEALVAGGRRWYADVGAHTALVQRNLGRLLITG